MIPECTNVKRLCIYLQVSPCTTMYPNPRLTNCTQESRQYGLSPFVDHLTHIITAMESLSLCSFPIQARSKGG